MQDKSLSFSKVLDIYGFRVIVKDTPACYLGLGALHQLYKPIPGKFKDYIAIPKGNGYQSLHTTLFGPFGSPIEIQIRTAEMHRIAEAGVASHWLYKSTDASLNELQRKTHQWLQSLLEMQSESADSIEFLEHLKVDLFPDETYVFTPKGKIMALPHGATCVDFAYSVHTDIGNRCVAAKVNHELVPLRTELKNGDRVEIITAAHAKPNPAWLNFVITAKARHHIRHFLKTMQYEESAQLGERLLAQALSALGGTSKNVRDGDWDRVLKDTGAKSKQEVLAEIGLGKVLAIVVARKLLPGGDGHDPHTGRGRPRGDPRIRGNGAAVREVLPPDPRRPDHRLHQEGPRDDRAHPRLPGDPQDEARAREVAGCRVGAGDAQAVLRQHQAAGVQRAGRAGQGGRRDLGERLEHRERQRRAGRQPGLQRHPFHAAGLQSPASCADHARPAAACPKSSASIG